MKHPALLLLLILLILMSFDSTAQKIDGMGGELSVFSLKANYRDWISRPTGFELFGGIASELDDFKPNDAEVGFKFLHAFMYERSERTYIGFVGKWKWIDVFDDSRRTSLPIPGIIIGREWLSKRINLKGFAVEVGYQFGSKKYEVYSPLNHLPIGKETFNEFPLILNLRYSFYTKRK